MTAQGFQGHLKRIVPREDAELTHVGPGTACGEYLRRYWQPVIMAERLKNLPVALTLMGEELVIFRDGSGAVGLLNRHCSHRGASLEYGVIRERGISCCYHGWHYACDGTILDIRFARVNRAYRCRQRTAGQGNAGGRSRRWVAWRALSRG